MNDVRTIRDRVPEDFAGDACDLARSILADLTKHPRLAIEVLLPLVTAEIDHLLRSRVRSVEPDASVLRRPAKAARNWRPAIDVKAAYLRERFALGDGTRVTWGEATVEQHRARIAMLTKTYDGIAETIARHQAAIEAISAAGVTCLGEITEVAA